MQTFKYLRFCKERSKVYLCWLILQLLRSVPVSPKSRDFREKETRWSCDCWNFGLLSSSFHDHHLLPETGHSFEQSWVGCRKCNSCWLHSRTWCYLDFPQVQKNWVCKVLGRCHRLCIWKVHDYRFRKNSYWASTFLRLRASEQNFRGRRLFLLQKCWLNSSSKV